MQAWADRATGDPATNRRIRNRLMNPIEFPAAGLLVIGVVVAAWSRLFLSLSADDAVWVGIGIATLIIVLGFFFASRPRISVNVIVGVLLLAAVVVIGLGIGGAVSGEREFHEPGAEGATVEEGG